MSSNVVNVIDLGVFVVVVVIVVGTTNDHELNIDFLVLFRSFIWFGLFRED